MSYPIPEFLRNSRQYFLLLVTLIVFACGGSNSERKKETRSPYKKEVAINVNKASKFKEPKPSAQENATPQKVYKVLEYVRQNNRSPEGYVGGKRFGNFEKLLPLKDENGKKLTYQEWDVNPRRHRENRGAERLITSNDHRAWYTSDHYQSFTELH